MKMLNVSERTVTRWKSTLKEQKGTGTGEGHPIFDDLLDVKEEPEDDYEEYEIT